MPDNIMSGYSMHVRELTDKDRAYYGVELPDGVPLHECIGVYGEDMGECLAAVIHLVPNTDHPLVWSDADGKGTPIAEGQKFADCLAFALVNIMPHLQR